MSVSGFWDWFLSEQVRLHDLPGADRAERLHERLSDLAPGLGVLTADDGGVAEVVFTASGRAEMAALVSDIVGAAPDLPGWKFVAFIPPTREPFTHERPGGFRVDSTDLRFEPLESTSRPGSIGLRLYLPDDLLAHPELSEAVWTIVVTAAGERLTFYVDHVDTASLDRAPVGALKLVELEQYLEWKATQVRL